MTEQEEMQALMQRPKDELEQALQGWIETRDAHDAYVEKLRAMIERAKARRDTAQSECSRYGAALANKKGV